MMVIPSNDWCVRFPVYDCCSNGFSDGESYIIIRLDKCVDQLNKILLYTASYTLCN